MTCQDAEYNTVLFLKKELDWDTYVDFVEHVTTCKSCYEELSIYHIAMTALGEEAEESYDFVELLEQKLEKCKREISICTTFQKTAFVFEVSGGVCLAALLLFFILSFL